MRSLEMTYACDCCGREMSREKLHALGQPPSYFCRRCGLWVTKR